MTGVIIKYSKKNSRLCRRFYLKWSDLFFELDSIDERCIENYKNLWNVYENPCPWKSMEIYGNLWKSVKSILYGWTSVQIYTKILNIYAMRW